MTVYADAIAVLGAAILFVCGVGVLALGARGWAYAIADAHRAESHGVELGERKTTYQQAHDAVEELEQRRARAEHDVPSDEELMQAVLAERARQGRDEYDTLSNEGIEPEPPIPEGGFYKTAEVLDR